MSINALVGPWYTITFLWMLEMTLNAAGCLGCQLKLKLCLDVLGCSLMYLDASWCTCLQLDVAGCILMYLIVAWCTWMQLDILAWSWVEILGPDVPWWYLMLISHYHDLSVKYIHIWGANRRFEAHEPPFLFEAHGFFYG